MLTQQEQKLIDRKFGFLSPAEQKDLLYRIENRITIHTTQNSVWEETDSKNLSGANMFGIKMLPRAITEPEWCESIFVIGNRVDTKAGGIVKVRTVRLRVWEDMTCNQAITVNMSMLARIAIESSPKNGGEFKFNTRMQTEVRVTVAMMWLQLRGDFYWNENFKDATTSMYLDRKSRILFQIADSDFHAWLVSHTGITDDKQDFKKLISLVKAASMNPEVSRGVKPSALFERKGDIIYISNGEKNIVKVSPSADGTALEFVDNGTDGVVFAQGAALAPWEIVKGCGVDPFDKEKGFPPFSTANYQTENGRMIARMWFLSLPSCIKSFPAIVFTGLFRSGKSRTAKAMLELLGAPVRLAEVSAEKNGAKDFWSVINKGGVVCFDNVDSRNEWFSDSMQLACTDGSRESRTLFSNDKTTTLRSNARIILTSNNPMFASESGLADRLQIVRLGQLNVDGNNESMDEMMTRAISEGRDGALTWMARTVSMALADKGKVQGNTNMRHPDFAAFALRASRALNKYEDAILALRSAEFDKALLSIQSNTKLNYVFEAMQDYFRDPEKREKPWVGKSSDLKKMIVANHPDLENSKYLTDTGLGMAMNRDIAHLSVLFNITVEKGAQTRYTFKGFSDAYLKNVSIDENETAQNSSNNDENDDDESPW